MRPRTPNVVVNDGSAGLIALTPQPDLRRRRPDRGRGIAHDRSRRVHQRGDGRGGGAVRKHRDLTGEVVRGRALGIGPRTGHDAQMAVLHAGMEPDTVAAAAEGSFEGRDDCMTLLVRGVTRGEVDHHRRFVVGERDEVAAVGNLVGTELDPHGRGLDRRAARVVPRRVEAQDRHVADIATRRQPRRNDRRAPDLGTQRERGQARHARRLERGSAPELGERDIGATIGNEDDVFHRRASYGAGAPALCGRGP